MADPAQAEENSNVLRRITAANGPAAINPLPVHRAFRISLGKIADRLFERELDIRSVEDTCLRQSDVIRIDIPDPLFFSISGPKGGPGLAVLSASLVSSLVELQTVGDVSAGTENKRPVTPAMAMLSHEYVDAVLTDIGDQMEIVTREEWVVSQKLGDPIFDLHRLPLEIPDIQYRMLRGEFSFGPDAPPSHLALILPATPTSSGSVELGSQTVSAEKIWKNRLETVVNNTTVTVEGILHRDQMTVDEIRNLEVGHIVPLPDGAEKNIRIEGMDGVTLGVGKIGMQGLSKAIKIAQVGEIEALSTLEKSASDHDPALVGGDLSLVPDVEIPTGEPAIPVDMGGMDLALEGTDFPSLDDLPELDIAN